MSNEPPVISVVQSGGSDGKSSQDAPDKIVVKQTLEKTLGEHKSPFAPTTSMYELIYQAQPGYRIVAHDFVPSSSNGLSQLTVQPVGNGAAVVVHFALTSGPQFDRYRGWIRGELTLVQERLADSKSALTAPAK
jgi:hypothetical protein